MAFATDLRVPDESYKDPPSIDRVTSWAGFYAGGHIGGSWGDGGQAVTVQGGTGGGGGGGGGDNNWLNNGSQLSLKNGAAGEGGNDGGEGGRGGNRTSDGVSDDLPANVSNPERRLGGNGGDGGPGGEVSGKGGDGDGVIGGLHLGYNWQHGNIVFGVEGDASFDGALDNYLASLRARVGVAHDAAFFYITGGLAIRDDGDADAIGLASDGGTGGTGGQNDDGIDDSGEETHAATRGGLGGFGGDAGTGSGAGSSGGEGGSDTGFVVGAGVEYMLSSNVSTGLEGLWYSFDDQDLTVLRARLTYHLNGSPHESFKDSYLSASIANWSGFYAGANAGVGFGNGKRVDSVKTAGGADGNDGQRGAKGNVNTANPGQFPASEGIDDPGGGGGGGGGGAAALVSLENDAGLLAGGHLGYNWQSGARVFGVEGDANWADENFRDYLASVRVRLGHAFDQVLIYGTAGVAFARSGEGVASVSLTSGTGGEDGQPGRDENDENFNFDAGRGGEGGEGDVATVTHSGGGEDKVGFVVGGGFEVKLWQQTSLGVEGLYYGFDGSNSVSTLTSYDAGDDLSTAVVRGRLTFHLDGEQDALK